MGSDRQSILLHEQGKKHKENVESALEQKRMDRQTQDSAAKELQKALAHMNSAAIKGHLQDVGRYGVSALHSASANNNAAAATGVRVPTPQQQRQKSAAPAPTINKKEEMAAWASKKKKREDEKAKDSDEDEEPETKKARRQLAHDEGNYTIGDNTYLEGVTFIDLLEDDMPVDVWIGAAGASLAEKRLLEKQHYWQTGLIIKIRKSSQDAETGKVLDVSYLKEANDTDETLEKSVAPNRIRILLGSDESLPDTLEEARIAATGGQVVAEPQQQQQQVVHTVDENTGLSSWGTIEIRKTTVRQELKEERERARLKRREEAGQQDEELKRAEGRRMEEARVDNAEDSALGAYDVWNAGKAGYKGVNIHANDKMTAADAAGTSLSGGKKVEFKKKSAFQKKGKKQNRRTTSADDL